MFSEIFDLLSSDKFIYALIIILVSIGILKRKEIYFYFINRKLKPHERKAFHLLHMYGQIEEFQKFFAQMKINPNLQQNYTKGSLLMSAINKCNKDDNAAELVKFLLQQGADPNICDNHGRSPFLMAVSWSNLEIARLLYQKGANPNQPTHRINTMYTNPLAIALYKKNIEMISFLLITCKADENLALEVINRSYKDYVIDSMKILQKFRLITSRQCAQYFLSNLAYLIGKLGRCDFDCLIKDIL